MFFKYKKKDIFINIYFDIKSCIISYPTDCASMGFPHTNVAYDVDLPCIYILLGIIYSIVYVPIFARDTEGLIFGD